MVSHITHIATAVTTHLLRSPRRHLFHLLLAITMLPALLVAAPPAPVGAELNHPEQVATVVSHDLNAYWYGVFARAGMAEYYQAPRGIFWYNTPRQPGPLHNTPCGTVPVQNSVYCPVNQSIYLDYGFHAQLMRGRGGGDFASGLVLAHEWGHHIQALLGLRASTEVMELQADCFAGTYSWSAAQRGLLEAGDLEEAYRVLWATGGGDHGSSEERVGWFLHGYRTGSPARCTP